MSLGGIFGWSFLESVSLNRFQYKVFFIDKSSILILDYDGPL
ncbi:hypothetical protein LEP1GSC008_0686 [Leptospira kirschneri serovar Bulgarica str. Nikolaevo]|uniref:Uncharacterized protein n=1 Tax=Leptospira kirschneri serovar Bulgarica str. Nikolaevo TaxID=1240687 RepID=M6F2B4_9LEPT|nr:hypothetical protein LEP1GSC008_0686 [Leptospira kirschneri serovar Bulgarica str. Nikolaevo]